MDCHEETNLITARKRLFCFPFMDLSLFEFPEHSACDRCENIKLCTILREPFNPEVINDSALETEHVRSSAGDIYGGCRYLPGTASPT